MDTTMLDTVRSRLEQVGIVLTHETSAGDGSDLSAVIRLSTADASAQYEAAVIDTTKTSVSLDQFAVSGPHPILAIGGHFDASTAAGFREARIQYVDATGNASVRFGQVLIEVRGRRGTRPPEDRGGSGAGGTQAVGNMFSTRRSQVIMALLAWPELWSATIRDLAAVAGVSNALAHDALALVEQAGFSHGGWRDQRRRGELLDGWTAAYRTGLGPKLAVASYTGDVHAGVRKSHSDRALYLSGESAHGIDLARSATMTIYLDDDDPKLPVVNRWRRDPRTEPNIFVRRKFWTAPHPIGMEPGVDLPNAPWPMVYADLMSAGDARLAEVAKTWRGELV